MWEVIMYSCCNGTLLQNDEVYPVLCNSKEQCQNEKSISVKIILFIKSFSRKNTRWTVSVKLWFSFCCWFSIQWNRAIEQVQRSMFTGVVLCCLIFFCFHAVKPQNKLWFYYHYCQIRLFCEKRDWLPAVNYATDGITATLFTLIRYSWNKKKWS